MFQYAALRGIANKTGTNFMVPDHREIFDDGIGNKYTILLFDVFNLKNASYKGMLNTVHYVQESHYHFDEEMFDLSKKENYSLYGFFQTEKYFKHIEDTVHSMFAFRPEILEPCQSMINGVEKPVSLHIRRGDYLTNYKNHHNLGLDYYAKALEHFKDNQIVIFSDDPAWCKQQELFKDDDRFLVSEENNQYMDMCLMSLCVGHIIANSSFSWWGAWLSKSKDVIAPSKWFGPDKQHLETKDLYCEDWTII